MTTVCQQRSIRVPRVFRWHSSGEKEYTRHAYAALPVPYRVVDSDGGGQNQLAGVGLGDSAGLCVAVGLALTAGDASGSGVTVGPGEGVLLATGLADGVGEGDKEGEGDGDGVGDGFKIISSRRFKICCRV